MGHRTRQHGLRTLEQDGIKAEVVGQSRRCALWINGQPYRTGINTLRAVVAIFDNYVRHQRSHQGDRA